MYDYFGLNITNKEILRNFKNYFINKEMLFSLLVITTSSQFYMSFLKRKIKKIIKFDMRKIKTEK